MYQFYYADTTQNIPHQSCELNVRDYFKIKAIRPEMWEEHCLECSAPVCFQSCVHYTARKDGRCKRFTNGIHVFQEEKACCGQAAHIRFRKWANMMTIIYPAMMTEDDYKTMTKRNQKVGDRLKAVIDSFLPQKVRWEIVRTVEWLRRRKLRKTSTDDMVPDAFLFHGYSYENSAYNLIVEIFDDHTPVFKTAIEIRPGENLRIMQKQELSSSCWKENYLVKVYPENDLEAELDILWCDFVQGCLIPDRLEDVQNLYSVGRTPAKESSVEEKENKSCQREVPSKFVKCVVWDLDGTVWDGTLIETENPDDLSIRPDVVSTMKALDEKGIMQSVASKNEFEVAWDVLKKMQLDQYFLYPQIHWNAKSGSLEQIAKSLNIGIDSLALIDDSAYERNQVVSVWPQVRTYDPSKLTGLLEREEFQAPVTEESRNRRAMYKAEENRTQLMRRDNDDTVTFLKKCHLRMRVFTPEKEDEISRCYELIVRTNQLNMTGKKYTRDEFQTVLGRENHKNIAFSCEDDFGSYGIVGFAQYSVEKDLLTFTEFAMSCRVAGKYVESALFEFLLDYEKCTKGRLQIIKTKKNSLLRRTLEEVGFTILTENINSVLFEFQTDLIHRDIVECLFQTET